MSRRIHMCISLEGALEHWEELTVTEEDSGTRRPATQEEVIEAVEGAKKKGYSVLPASCCNNVDKDGYCQGHQVCPYHDGDSESCKLGPTSKIVDNRGKVTFSSSCDDELDYESCPNFIAAEEEDDDEEEREEEENA